MNSLLPPAITAPSRRWPMMLLALLLQALVLGHTYSKLLFHPGEYLIIDHYDGIKSYFSVATYLRQPLSDGGLVRGHNYPFGDYIYYTDSTPLLEVPLHFLVQHVPALAPYGLYLYDIFILSGILISTSLLVLLLRRLQVSPSLLVLLSVSLPWLNPQTIRLNVGHMSLSYTPALLFMLWALHHLYTAWHRNDSLVKSMLLLFSGIVVASWLHFYYLPLLGGLLVFFVSGLLLIDWRRGRPWRALVVGTGTVLIGALALTWGALNLLDPRYHQRPIGSGGYGWIEWKFQFGALFRGYVFNKIRFVLERTAEVPYESASYLGSFVLFGLLLVGILLVLRRLPKAAYLPPLRVGDQGHFLLLLLASLPLVLIALGETIELDNGAYVIQNYLNIFKWLHKLTERITQFRALGRFVWPFWWAVVLGFGWYASRWRRLPGLRWALAVLCVLLVVDTLNATRHYRHVTQRTNFLTWPAATETTRQLLSGVQPARYQAILPLPYYHAGTTDSVSTFSYNIDPDDWHCNDSYKLAMVSGLPLMSHKSTRTITSDARHLYSIFSPTGPDPQLLARLDRRPVLVFLDSSYYDGHNNYYRDLLRDRPEMRAAFERGPVFIQEQHMRRVAHAGSTSLYEWQPFR